MLSSGADLGGSDIDGRYVLKSKLGEGGMGIVYKAIQLSTSREVAFKIVKVDVGDDVRLERFKQEVEIISTLSHPNIVRVIDTGTVDDHDLLYVVMELIEGIPLSDLLWHKHAEGQYFKVRTRVEFALEVAYQLCAALTEPHRQGIIHRDIKPENILISPSSDETVQLKVLDFGIARVLNTSKSQKKMTDSRIPFVGTPHYMAPEQVARSQYDARTDLYAVGVVLFEMLSAQYPFDNENLLALLLQKTQKDPPSLASMLPEDHGLLQDVIDLTDQLLARDQDARPGDAMKVRRMIEDIRDEHRLRRVRIDMHDFFERSRVPILEESLDEDERLEPYRKLYRSWLLYPSGKPLVSQGGVDVQSSDVEPVVDVPEKSVSAAEKPQHTSEQFFDSSPNTSEPLQLPKISPVLPALSEPVSSAISQGDVPPDEADTQHMYQAVEQEEIDLADEVMDSHTDVLAAPKRNKLKAWHVDISWTNSFDVSDLKQSELDVDAMEDFFEEDDDEIDELDEVATSIWKPEPGQFPSELMDTFAAFEAEHGDSSSETSSSVFVDATQESSGVDEPSVELGMVPPAFAPSPDGAKHTPDFGAMPVSLGNSGESVPRDAETIRERAFASHVIGQESYPSHSDTIPEPMSVKSPEIQQMLAEAKQHRENHGGQEDALQQSPMVSQSLITSESGLHSLMSRGGHESPVAKVALFDEDDMSGSDDLPLADAAVSVLSGSHLRDPSLSIAKPASFTDAESESSSSGPDFDSIALDVDVDLNAPLPRPKRESVRDFDSMELELDLPSEPQDSSSEPDEPSAPALAAPAPVAPLVNDEAVAQTSSKLPLVLGLLVVVLIIVGAAIFMS